MKTCGLKVKSFGKTRHVGLFCKLHGKITTDRHQQRAIRRIQAAIGILFFLEPAHGFDFPLLSLLFSLLETITDLFLGSCGRFLISHAESICPSLRGPLSRVQLNTFPLTFCPFLFCFSRQLPAKPGAGSRCPRTVHRPLARILSGL